MTDEQAGGLVAEEVGSAAVSGNHALLHQAMSFILNGRLDQPDAFVLIQAQAEFRPVAAEQGMLTAPFS